MSRRLQTHYHVHGEKILRFVTIVVDRFSFAPGISLLLLFVDMHGFGRRRETVIVTGRSAVGHALDLDLAVVAALMSLADAEAESGALPTLVAEEQRKDTRETSRRNAAAISTMADISVVCERSANTVILSESVVACAAFSKEVHQEPRELIGVDADIRQIGEHPVFQNAGSCSSSSPRLSRSECCVRQNPRITSATIWTKKYVHGEPNSGGRSLGKRNEQTAARQASSLPTLVSTDLYRM